MPPRATSSWPWSVPEKRSNEACRTLLGIQSSPELQSLLQQALGETTAAPNFFTMSRNDAMNVIQEYNNDDDKKEKKTYIPLDVIRAATSLLKDPTALSKAVSIQPLVYSAPPSSATKVEDAAFTKRMERLRLRAEESSYKRLTGNLDTTVQDDVTVRSMTYAASVGLNMIVAPISFGVFMYFFAGQIFSFFDDENSVPLKPHETDIKRVIAGVISGVIMLFIEMILFVIRTHTMEASMLKKRKRNPHVSPFGHVKPTTMTTPMSTTTGSKTSAALRK